MKTTGNFFTKLLSVFMCVVYIIAGLPATELVSHAAAVTPTSGNIYYIKNKNSGMYLTVENDSASNGANVIQATGTGSLGQRWIPELCSDGTYRLHPATDLTGGISLDVANGSTEDGTNIQIWENNGCTAQQFGLVKSGDGYSITMEVTGQESCLDVLDFSTESGANVIQWTNNESDNQIWFFEEAQWPQTSETDHATEPDRSSDSENISDADDLSASVPQETAATVTKGETPTAGNIYYIKNKNSGMYLTVENDSASNGANVIQATGTGSLGQRWIPELCSDGTYRLHPATDMTGGISLDVAYGSTENGANIQIWENNGYSAQQFGFVESGDGYAITTKVTNQESCLDVERKSTQSGANVLQYTNRGADNQIWYFEVAQWPGSNPDTSDTTVSCDTSYAMQRIQFMSTYNNQFITAPEGKGTVSLNSTSSTFNQWVLMNDGSGKYMIANAKTGYVLAPADNNAASGAALVATGKTGATAQYWKMDAVNTDCNGSGLSYRISNCANTNLSIIVNNEKLVLGTYSGASAHMFYINSYGAEGFAGKCYNMNKNMKASITGGLFGATVTVSDFDSLSKYCAGATPYTIVINGNISKSDLTKIFVGSNKTIIGSFTANTLNNIHFRCTSNTGNVIFKNITFQHDADKNANDDIQMYISSGNNFWLDHCSFMGHSALTSSDVDKHLYVGLKADYVSVTGCVFMNHKYGLILGYPEEDGVGTYDGYPRMTICNNYFHGVLTRAPGLMRYGYFHAYNNYIYDFNLGYTPYTGANIYSENNYFAAGSHTGAVVDDKGVGGFTDVGSVLSYDISSLKTGATSFRPSNNYSYNVRNAADAKTWCSKYAGVTNGSIHYAID
jgi:pectate lyase